MVNVHEMATQKAKICLAHIAGLCGHPWKELCDSMAKASQTGWLRDNFLPTMFIPSEALSWISLGDKLGNNAGYPPLCEASCALTPRSNQQKTSSGMHPKKINPNLNTGPLHDSHDVVALQVDYIQFAFALHAKPTVGSRRVVGNATL